MTRTETKTREKERQRQNRIPVIAVIAHTCWKKLLHKFFPRALNHLLFLQMRFLKWMHWFFLCSGMKLEFFLTTGIK